MEHFRTALDFHIQGLRAAFAVCAANEERWQAISITCPSCGFRYVASVSRRSLQDSPEAVRAYPDVAAQIVLAGRVLERECPDHPYRVRVRPFSVVA